MSALNGKNELSDVVYFDVETKRRVDPKLPIESMGVTVGVTYSSRTGKYSIYLEEEVEAMIDQLARASLVVGYNILHFDYRVLHAYTALDLTMLPTVDMLVDIEKSAGNRLKLESIAQATVGVGKTNQGLEAVKLYRENRWMELAEYCCYDVKLTKLIYEHGASHGKIFYMDKMTGKRKETPVHWPRPAGLPPAP
jgi:DEAD/DEAH box helicase domain-containing protein